MDEESREMTNKLFYSCHASLCWRSRQQSTRAPIHTNVHKLWGKPKQAIGKGCRNEISFQLNDLGEPWSKAPLMLMNNNEDNSSGSVLTRTISHKAKYTYSTVSLLFKYAKLYNYLNSVKY